MSPNAAEQERALSALQQQPPAVMDAVLGPMVLYEDVLIPGVRDPTHGYLTAAFRRTDGDWPARFARLTALAAFCPPDTRDLEWMERVPGVVWLQLNRCPHSHLLGHIADMTGLRHLGITDIAETLDLTDLGGSLIESLVLERAALGSSISFFLPRLRRLAVWQAQYGFNLWLLEGHPRLEHLRVSGELCVQSVEALSTLPALQSLDLRHAELIGGGDRAARLADACQGLRLARLLLPTDS